MIRHVVPVAALLAAAVAIAQPKVSGGDTPPEGGKSPARTAGPDKATAPAPGRSDEARKALGALKGQPAKGRRDERKPGGR